MFLYTIGIEELLVCVSLNLNIIGYTIKVSNNLPIQIKSSAYADDTVGLQSDLKSIELFFKEFKRWGKVSGASMNESKTKILALNSEHKYLNNIIFVEKIKILGITFNKNGLDMDNLSNCIKKIENTFNLWNHINLNMLERITVLKTFALSKLW